MDQRIADAKCLPTSTHPRPPGCQPWCTEHHDGGQHPEDSYCLGVVPTPAGDLLLGFTDGGPRVFLWQLRDVDLTLADAARLHEALGELLAAAPQGELVGGVL